MSNSIDYSTLFSSLNSSDTLGISYTDYASIKNGSYAKLTKAYYASKSSSSSSSSSTKTLTEEQTTRLTKVKTAASELNSAASAISTSLLESGDTDAIYKAVSDFADKYNTLVSSINTDDNKAITNTANNMMNSVSTNLTLLSNAGITLDTDGKMSVNEDTLKSNITTLKTLFGTTGSFGSSIASSASSISYKATSALNVSKNYTSSASYSDSSYVGELYDTYN